MTAIVLVSFFLFGGHSHCQSGNWDEHFYLLYKYEGYQKYQGLGSSVYLPGDLDLDGYGDILFGAPGEDVGGNETIGRGYVYSGFDGSLLYSYTGEHQGAAYGSALCGLGDTDGDGYPEFLFGAKQTDGIFSSQGKVYHYSAKTGNLIKSYYGESGGDHFGNDLKGLGDVNGDDMEDFIVGAWSYEINPPPYHVGAAYVFSGTTKAVLYKFEGIYSGEYLGNRVCKTGDVDKDGFNDFAYLTPLNGAPPANVGIVTIRSGRKGSLIHEIWGNSPGSPLYEIAFGGDVNGDGWPDLLIGQPWFDENPLQNVGRAYVYSGRDWSVLYMYTGILENQGMGGCVSTAGDINEDGCSDFMFIGGPAESGHIQSGAIYLHSGKDGSLIAYLYGADYSKIGVDIHGGSDINADGLLDLIVSTNEDVNGQVAAGSVWIYVSKSLKATNQVPLGGDLELDLRVPAMPLGLYYLAFSLGKDPGLPLGTRTIPLNPDVLFFSTFANPAFTGNLDGEGEKQLTVQIPNNPALSGLVFYSAFMMYDVDAPKCVRTISNPEAIEIQ